jgi:cobyrinic acid a,c-diamide synthase
MSISGGQPRIVVAGVASGVGKTTIATGLMAALATQGLRVQGYKVGPDYIDPTYHRAATARPSYNLDIWLSSQALVRKRFDAGMRNADIAIIEGVMGLFDGRKNTRDSASTAEVARLLNAPVLLVIDVSHMGQSVAALVNGFQNLDPRVHVAGVILNKVASADHEATLKHAIAEWTGIPVLGTIRRDTGLSLPARHLGLVPVPETTIEAQALADSIKRSVDVEGIVNLARFAGPLPELITDTRTDEIVSFPFLQSVPPVRIGLALDAAFSFYYPETLETFANMGVEIVPFSPLKDNSPPDDIDLLYFGGGFPEVFAGQLAENHAMLAGVRSAVQRGVLVYAECGGYMYLGKCCIDAANMSHQLLGVLPYTFQMGTERAQLGYREITMVRDTILGPAGTHLRGHEFHWSQIVDPLSREHAAYQLEEREDTREGYASKTILASYVHVPLAANPSIMIRLIHNCLSHRNAMDVIEKRDNHL